MTNPSISFSQERKPAHYVGADVSITLCSRNTLPKWQIDLIESMFTTLLTGSNYEEIENSEGFTGEIGE